MAAASRKLDAGITFDPLQPLTRLGGDTMVELYGQNDRVPCGAHISDPVWSANRLPKKQICVQLVHFGAVERDGVLGLLDQKSDGVLA